MFKQLSGREQQVTNLVLNGLTNEEIAETLHVSIHTVKAHLNNIFEKLECKRGKVELMVRRIKELERCLNTKF